MYDAVVAGAGPAGAAAAKALCEAEMCIRDSGYTVSESYLGEALSGGLREKFILATKSMSRGYADMARVR